MLTYTENMDIYIALRIHRYLRQRVHMCFVDAVQRDLAISTDMLRAALAWLMDAKRLTMTAGGRLVGAFSR